MSMLGAIIGDVYYHNDVANIEDLLETKSTNKVSTISVLNIISKITNETRNDCLNILKQFYNARLYHQWVNAWSKDFKIWLMSEENDKYSGYDFSFTLIGAYFVEVYDNLQDVVGETTQYITTLTNNQHLIDDTIYITKLMWVMKKYAVIDESMKLHDEENIIHALNCLKISKNLKESLYMAKTKYNSPYVCALVGAMGVYYYEQFDEHYDDILNFVYNIVPQGAERLIQGDYMGYVYTDQGWMCNRGRDNKYFRPSPMKEIIGFRPQLVYIHMRHIDEIEHLNWSIIPDEFFRNFKGVMHSRHKSRFKFPKWFQSAFTLDDN